MNNTKDNLIAERDRLLTVNAKLLAALRELFEDYKRLADSGDAGFWRLEDQNVGKLAIAALTLAEQAGRKS